MSSARRKNTPRARKGKGAKPKRRITARHATSAWLALVLVSTGAWFFLVQQPNSQDIAGLETTLRRAESRLSENEERVTDLTRTIRDLTLEVDAFTATLERADPYTTHHSQSPAEHLATITELLQRAGLDVNSSTAPDRWTRAAPTFHEATLNLAATGTYERFNTALTLLERGQLGTRVREAVVAKIGGDPDDPILDIRLTLDVIARERATVQEN